MPFLPKELEAHLSSCSCCLKADVGQEDFGFYDIATKSVSIVYKRFPTHLPTYYSKKTGKPGKMYKISGQAIYSGQMPFIVRSSLMRGLKERFIIAPTNLRVKLDRAPMLRKCMLVFEYGVPINYGDVRRTPKGTISWLPAKPGFSPDWDLSNLWPMRKSIEDALVGSGLLKDDNVGVVKSIEERVNVIEDLNDRYIRVIIKPHK